MGKFLGIDNIQTSLNDFEKCGILTTQELYQPDIVRRFGLDPKVIKTRRTNSSQPLGSCMSL